MRITPEEVVETLTMITQQSLDIRTVTLGLSLAGCVDSDVEVMARRVYDHVTTSAERLLPVAEQIEREYGIPICNKRISVTPVAQLAAACSTEDITPDRPRARPRGARGRRRLPRRVLGARAQGHRRRRSPPHRSRSPRRSRPPSASARA